MKLESITFIKNLSRIAQAHTYTHGPISLMRAMEKTLNKILSNGIQEHATVTLQYHYKAVYSEIAK